MSLRVAVIGAGPAGATAAYCLAKAGVEVDVYEASGGVGGLARSVDLWGQTVGLGPQHLLSADPRVNELWLEVIGGDYEMVQRRTRTYRGGRLHDDPPRRPWQLLRPRTVVSFAHPRRGPGEVYERMCDFVEKQGGRVHVDTPVAGLERDESRVTGVRLNSGEVREHDHVVSSMPLPVRAGHTVIVYLHTTAESVFPDTWIDVRDPDLSVARITNFDNWVPTAKRGERETVLALEYACDGDAWRWDDARFIALGREEIVRSGLVGAHEILDAEALRVPKSIQWYRMSLQTTAAESHLRELSGLSVVSSPGHQARGMLLGLLAAENIVEDAGHDLWTAAPLPFPASHITATGLVLA
ncbi:FAD-dependent oxidoreductase [Dactylosporangium sp. CS-033363]|uniref:FAD-dependent oxidoreductase n=1 Tax=Dactylosporangium sp. CS-033363 TaxID=3239935 RepID=UPI003D90BA2B